MIYKIRVILNAEEDVIRDLAIESGSNLEDLHNAIINGFGFTGEEMASFYLSDAEWTQGEEFPLFDMSEGNRPVMQMRDAILKNVLASQGDRLIYVYDFFNMWSFYVELIDTEIDHSETELPAVLFSLGLVPSQAPEIHFESEDPGIDDDADELSEDLDIDMFSQSGSDFKDFNFN